MNCAGNLTAGERHSSRHAGDRVSRRHLHRLAFQARQQSLELGADIGESSLADRLGLTAPPNQIQRILRVMSDAWPQEPVLWHDSIQDRRSNAHRMLTQV